MAHTRHLLYAALVACCAAPTLATAPPAIPKEAATQPADQSDAEILAQQQMIAQFETERPDAAPEDWSRTMVRSCVRVGNRMTC